MGHLIAVKKQTEHIELSQEQIIQKLESFCSYRERCTSEINQKLYQLKADANDFEFYINYLKENNFLNETRFANSFARGKNAIKKWGRKKIVMELKSKQIDNATVQQSLLQIDEGMYLRSNEKYCILISLKNDHLRHLSSDFSELRKI